MAGLMRRTYEMSRCIPARYQRSIGCEHDPAGCEHDPARMDMLCVMPILQKQLHPQCSPSDQHMASTHPTTHDHAPSQLTRPHPFPKTYKTHDHAPPPSKDTRLEPYIVGGSHVRSSVEQQVNAVRVPFECSHVEWRVPDLQAGAAGQ